MLYRPRNLICPAIILNSELIFCHAVNKAHITDSFLGQFTGVATDEFAYTKTGKQADNEIDAISSATYTTRSMTHGVNAALAAYRAMQKSSILMGAMEGGAVNE